MPRELRDPQLPGGSRALGYALRHPWDDGDYALLLAEQCDHRRWVLEGAVLGDGPASGWYGAVDDEWPRLVRAVVRLGVHGVVTPSLEHFAATRAHRYDRARALADVGVVVRTVRPIGAMTP